MGVKQMVLIMRRLLRTATLVSMTFAFLIVTALAGSPPVRVPGSPTRYEIATRDDLLFEHMLAPLMKGDVPDWLILGGIGKQLGGWFDQFVGAQQITNIITEAFPVEGQPALRPIDAEVERCAQTLGVAKPAVYVRNSPFTQAYVVRAFNQDHLVLTSGLLALYAGRPEELRFVIGHELGHVKCGHLELKHKAFGLLAAVQTINLAVVPDKYQAVLPTLALGRLYTWCRESEISADRAGLLCCGETKAAYQAIMRLQHGLNKDSPWIDPESKDFDPQQVIKSFQQWQYQPFVKLLIDLKRHVLIHPFVPERLAALKAWADTGAYRVILGRQGGGQDDHLIEVVEIQAFELAPEGQTADPYVIVFDGDTQVLRTAPGTGQREARWHHFRSTDRGVNQPRSFRDGQPLFFEIWDSDYGDDAFIGGFVVYPDVHDSAANNSGTRVAEYTAKILWDWKGSQEISRAGFARVSVRFLKRQSSTQDNTSQNARL
jgi:Zn-dependent protease with chaperone function